MDWLSQNYLWIVVIAFAVLSAGTWVFKTWRKSQHEEQNNELWDLIELTLDMLRNLAQGALRDLQVEEVRAAAGQVYDDLIAPTPLASFVSRPIFVETVVEQWRRAAGVEESVAVAVWRARAADAEVAEAN